MQIWRERVTGVWLALMALTVLTTWGLSKDLFSPAVAVVGTFLIAGAKVRYVMWDFMELRFGPAGARVFFGGWILAVLGTILGFWFLTTA